MVSTVVGRVDSYGFAFGPLPGSLDAPTKVNFDGAGNLFVGSIYAIVKVRFDD